MMDPFLKVTQGSFHQAMYVLVQQLADDLSRVVFILFYCACSTGKKHHRSAEKAVFMYIACREIKTNRTTTSHLVSSIHVVHFFFCGIFCCKKTSLLNRLIV